VDQTLWLAPRLPVRPFRTFFCTAGGFGTLTLDEHHALTIDLAEGELRVRQLHLALGAAERRFELDLVATPQQPGRFTAS
jgi:hypothetical protein